MAQKINPCPKCGCPEIFIYPSYGGKGSGDLTSYCAQCNGCKFEVDHLSKDGSKRSAISEWNRYVKEIGSYPTDKKDHSAAEDSRVLNWESKGKVDVIIQSVKGEKDWSLRPALFAKLFSESGINPDALVLEDRRYIPVSIYMMLGINDTIVSDFFFKEYGDHIQKTFAVPEHGDTKYSYLGTFYHINEAEYNRSTDLMTGAVFLLKDISFNKNARRNDERTVQWLQYLLSQIDRYMEEGADKDAFRLEIETELGKTKAAFVELKKRAIAGQLDRQMDEIAMIDDIDYLVEIKKTFDRKINERIME